MAIPRRSGSRPTTGASIETHLDAWIDRAAEGISYAVVDALSVIDFEAAVIDGALPASVRKRIVARIIDKLATLDTKGLPTHTIVEGSIGNRARAIGAASLPFLAKFMRDRELLFRDPADMRPAVNEPPLASRLAAS